MDFSKGVFNSIAPVVDETLRAINPEFDGLTLTEQNRLRVNIVNEKGFDYFVGKARKAHRDRTSGRIRSKAKPSETSEAV